MIELPSTLSTDVASSSSAFLGEVSPLLSLILGVLLASIVIAIIIGALKK